MADDKKNATINTIQHSVYVARLAIPRYRNYNWFIPYDVDNLYPQKIKAIAERSVTCSSAIGTHADFLSGQGFGEGVNEIDIAEQYTLEELLKDKANDLALYRGLSIHFNFNRKGQIVEINEIPFEGLRWDKDQKMLVYSEDWTQVYNLNKEIIKYYPFSPDTVIEEIKKEGIENYTGQVLYFIPKKRDIYTVCRFDAALNDAQFEDESTVYKLCGIQNDYALGGLIKLPTPLMDDEQFADTKNTLQRKGRGAANNSKWILIPAGADSEAIKAKLFEPMVRTNVDSLFVNQNRAAESNIYKSYQQPPILNGVSNDGMFNQDQFMDAFDYYNSKTQDERDTLEKIFNRFWEYTIWYSGEKLKIIPKAYIQKRNNGTTTTAG